MSDVSRLTIPVKCFIAGILPFIIMTVLDYFELLNLHGGLGTLFLMIITFTAPPICFTGGFISALRSTDSNRGIGLTLNGLGLGILFSLLVYVWLTN